jgi:phosphoenolpyruvate-protein kinase (PTS system EI component)
VSTRIGQGVLLSAGPFAGAVVRGDVIDDVIALLGQDLSGAILVTEHASATAVAPILPRLSGVICTQGGPASHLAIMARGLGVPCVVQARFTVEPSIGQPLRVNEAGEVFA